MSYSEWFQSHGQKHAEIMTRLKKQGLNQDAIIAYFDFDSMVRNEPDFCPLYAENKKCHTMEKLNCFLCACPLFRFQDSGIRISEGKTVMSECSIDSKKGKQFIYGDQIHQDCSECLIPHKVHYIRQHSEDVWFTIMQDVYCDRATPGEDAE